MVMLTQAKHEVKESKELKEEKSDDHFFDRIYHAAKAGNAAAIAPLLKEVSIDVQSYNRIPVEQLAAEGDSKAVEFLRKQFNASVPHMVRGYAVGGYVDYVNEELKNAPPALRPALLRMVAQGYAQGKHLKAINDLLEKNPSAQFDLYQSFIFGFALGKHVAEAKKIVEQVKTANEKVVLLELMASGFSLAGHINEANSVLDSIVDQEQQFAMMKKMIYGYARCGCHAGIDDLMGKRRFNPQEQLELMQEMARGFARTGQIASVTKILEEVRFRNNDIQLIFFSEVGAQYSLGGHIAAVKELFKFRFMRELDRKKQFKMLTEIAHGFALNGNAEVINDLLKFATNFIYNFVPADRLALLTQIISGYAVIGHLAPINEIYNLATLSDRPALLKIIINELKKKNVFINEQSNLHTLALFAPVLQIEIVRELAEQEQVAAKAEAKTQTLLRKGIKLHQVMKSQHLNFHQATGWIDLGCRDLLIKQEDPSVKKRNLPSEVFSHIASYLLGTSESETDDLMKKLVMHRDRLFKQDSKKEEEKKKGAQDKREEKRHVVNGSTCP